MASSPYEPVPIPDDTDWRNSGACVTVGGDIWFPTKADSIAADKAIAICGGCPVRDLCLQAGMFEKHGIWGGKTPDERKRMKPERDAAIAKLSHAGFNDVEIVERLGVSRSTVLRVRAELNVDPVRTHRSEHVA